jgi:hypothetical protein
MTEAEWLACRDPHEMLARVESASKRKLRLLACAACRRVWSEIRDERCRDQLRAAEQYADGLINEPALERASEAAEDAFCEILASKRSSDVIALHAAVGLAAGEIEACDISAVFRATADVAPFGSNEPATQVGLIHEIFCNPFRLADFAASWRTSDVMLLANGISAANAFDRMPILADALQEAGCDSADILDHCRGPGPHVRGCWVVDSVLGMG